MLGHKWNIKFFWWESNWSLFEQTSWWDFDHWFGIDSLQACIHVDIDSWRYHAHWFGIDSLQACVRVDINSLRDPAHWFGNDSLQIMSSFDIDSKVKMSCTWIDMRNPYGVGHILQKW